MTGSNILRIISIVLDVRDAEGEINTFMSQALLLATHEMTGLQRVQLIRELADMDPGERLTLANQISPRKEE